ncbi:GPO family capsid scaffolding protein [Microbulbifer spongiae]|uniref:GPO family capsid scaffolding protein n=1 Tax=Microbulbifer spongiae TaxID=2944933 RepID=UPI00345E6B95
MALLGQIDPTKELVQMNKKRQKLYSSIEVDPDFAGSGEAYLVGMAITDSPATRTARPNTPARWMRSAIAANRPASTPV